MKPFESTVTMPSIKVGELKLHYEIYGEGEPVVLIPGFRTGLWLWFRQVESLAQNFRVLVFDPRGIGQSESPGRAIHDQDAGS